MGCDQIREEDVEDRGDLWRNESLMYGKAEKGWDDN